MPEEKAEKKKPGIVRRILKWFGLGLLAVLIILGLIFQAPWKVIALLLIILAVCTQLPRPARKYFWLSAAAVVIALIIWVFLPDDNEGWRPYTFDKELAALEAKRPAIPDSENAATIYNQLLDNYDANTAEPNFLDYDLDYLTRREPWSSKDHPEIAQWLKTQQSTIETLIQASKIEKCRFPISKDIFDFVSVHRVAAMRHWAFLLVRAGNNDLGESRIDQALKKNIAVLQMGKHLCQQPTFVELLVGNTIEAIAIEQFNRFVVTGDATEAPLSVIEEALAKIKHDWSSDLLRILECEKLFVKSTFGTAYEINPEGKVRLSRDPTAISRARFPGEFPPPTYWQRKLMKAKTILRWFYMPSTPLKLSEIVDSSYERLYAMAEPDFDWQKEPREVPITSLFSTPVMFNYRRMTELTARMLEPNYYSIHDIYLRTITQQRGCQIIIALRPYESKNGCWPETLDDIKNLASTEIFVDPINGNSFVYKLTEENFTLYSKGKNNIDEDGIRSVTFDPNDFIWLKIEEDDILIWPPRNRKTKEENTDVEQQ